MAPIELGKYEGVDVGTETVVEGGDKIVLGYVDAAGKTIEAGNVPIVIPLEKLAFDKTTLSMQNGTQEELNVVATPAAALEGKTVVWASSDY